jgi:hypothetical protein
VTIARVAAITYGKRPDDPAMLESGIGRTEAMAYRDARGQAMAGQGLVGDRGPAAAGLPAPQGSVGRGLEHNGPELN